LYNLTVWFCKGDTKVGVSSGVICGRGSRTFARHGHWCLGTEGFISGSPGSGGGQWRAQGGCRGSGGGRLRAQRDCAEAEAVQRALRHDASQATETKTVYLFIYFLILTCNRKVMVEATLNTNLSSRLLPRLPTGWCPRAVFGLRVVVTLVS
jgi:hypothetical protein